MCLNDSFLLLLKRRVNLIWAHSKCLCRLRSDIRVKAQILSMCASKLYHAGEARAVFFFFFLARRTCQAWEMWKCFIIHTPLVCRKLEAARCGYLLVYYKVSISVHLALLFGNGVQLDWIEIEISKSSKYCVKYSMLLYFLIFILPTRNFYIAQLRNFATAGSCLFRSSIFLSLLSYLVIGALWPWLPQFTAWFIIVDIVKHLLW